MKIKEMINEELDNITAHNDFANGARYALEKLLKKIKEPKENMDITLFEFNEKKGVKAFINKRGKVQINNFELTKEKFKYQSTIGFNGFKKAIIHGYKYLLFCDTDEDYLKKIIFTFEKERKNPTTLNFVNFCKIKFSENVDFICALPFNKKTS